MAFSAGSVSRVVNEDDVTVSLTILRAYGSLGAVRVSYLVGRDTAVTNTSLVAVPDQGDVICPDICPIYAYWIHLILSFCCETIFVTHSNALNHAVISSLLVHLISFPRVNA